jgi:hypothetical protein
MPGRAGVIVVLALLAAAAGFGGGGDDRSSNPKLRAGDVATRARRFAECAKKSEYKVARPEPRNERPDFLHEEGFEFAEVDLEEQPLLFFAAIVDFSPAVPTRPGRETASGRPWRGRRRCGSTTSSSITRTTRGHPSGRRSRRS